MLEITIRKFVLAGSFAFSNFIAKYLPAEDFFLALRGPTKWQVDGQCNIAEESKVTTSIALKYWSGDNIGGWGAATLPYDPDDGKITHIAINGGVRGSIGEHYHWFALAGATVPFEGGSIDGRVGYMGTVLLPRRFEIDGIIARTFTGTDQNGYNPRDRTYGGIFAGYKRNKFRVGLGYLNYDGRSVGRVGFRYDRSDRFHLETLVDLSNGERDYSMSLIGRRNFGRTQKKR